MPSNAWLTQDIR